MVGCAVSAAEDFEVHEGAFYGFVVAGFIESGGSASPSLLDCESGFGAVVHALKVCCVVVVG